jgi:diacylglycerol kinase family enzyme
MRSALRAATDRWPSSRQRRSRTASRSSAFQPARATTSRSTSASTAALDAFTDGVECLIDTAEVNGRLFLNNVSLGIYCDAVRQPAYRDAKARTLMETAARVLGPSRAADDLEVVDDEGRPHVNPAVVLVSNGPYSLEPPHAPGTRPTLDGGELGIIVLDAPEAGPGPGRTWTATRLEVTAPAPLHTGVDGEAVDLTPPLELVTRPGTLRVRIASSHLRVTPAGRVP